MAIQFTNCSIILCRDIESIIKHLIMKVRKFTWFEVKVYMSQKQISPIKKWGEMSFSTVSPFNFPFFITQILIPLALADFSLKHT